MSFLEPSGACPSDVFTLSVLWISLQISLPRTLLCAFVRKKLEWSFTWDLNVVHNQATRRHTPSVYLSEKWRHLPGRPLGLLYTPCKLAEKKGNWCYFTPISGVMVPLLITVFWAYLVSITNVCKKPSESPREWPHKRWGRPKNAWNQ